MLKLFVISLRIIGSLKDYLINYKGEDEDLIDAFPDIIDDWQLTKKKYHSSGYSTIDKSSSSTISINLIFNYDTIDSEIENVIEELKVVINDTFKKSFTNKDSISKTPILKLEISQRDKNVNNFFGSFDYGWKILYSCNNQPSTIIIPENTTPEQNTEIIKDEKNVPINEDVVSSNETPPNESSDLDNPVIPQSETENNNNNTEKDNSINEFEPVKLTQFFGPTIIPTEISFSVNNTEKEKSTFLQGFGSAPFVYYNGIQIEYTYLKQLELYHENILPSIKLTFEDANGMFKDDGFPTDDAIISIYINSRSKIIRSIKMDFKITSFKELGGSEYTLNGIVDIPEIYLRDFKSYSKKSSFETLKQLAKDIGIGFCSNISSTNDDMTWINTGIPVYKFINNIVRNSYLSDVSFFSCYIDFYYNLCFIDIEKELNRDIEEDKMILSTGKGDMVGDPNLEENIINLGLTTDKSAIDSNAYVSEYTVLNKSSKVSIEKAYSTVTKFYDTTNKDLLVFEIDSLTTTGDKSIIMKGKPNDVDYFNKNKNSIWLGKIDKFENGTGNSHINYLYSEVQNRDNKDEISKIFCDVKLPMPNFNFFVYQKIPLMLISQKPGLSQKSLRHKRLSGNWLIVGITFVFDSGEQYQRINLIKRELEVEEDEEDITKNNKNKKNNNEAHENELSPLDDVVEPIGPTSSPVELKNEKKSSTTKKYDLDYVVGHTMKDNKGVIRTLVVVDGQPVDEDVAIAFLEMQDAAKSDGVKFSINSGFRPAFGANFKGKTSKGKNVNITTQESLRRDKSRWVTSKRAQYKSDDEFVMNAPSSAFDPQTAPPGKSNHGSAIALDLSTGSRISFSRVLRSKEYTWLVKNSWKYGFVRGVRSEEWHFEYRPDSAKKGPYAVVSNTGNVGSDRNNLFYSDLGLNNLNLV